MFTKFTVVDLPKIFIVVCSNGQLAKDIRAKHEQVNKKKYICIINYKKNVIKKSNGVVVKIKMIKERRKN